MVLLSIVFVSFAVVRFAKTPPTVNKPLELRLAMLEAYKNKIQTNKRKKKKKTALLVLVLQ